MFEKEAEEYREKEKDKGYYWVTQEMEQLELDTIIDESFKDGAEFGYKEGIKTLDDMTRAFNREHKKYTDLRIANEWHYVKDGIFPIHSNRVLVFTDEGVGFGIFGLDNKRWYTYDTGFEVIAWKEIVLPKESE